MESEIFDLTNVENRKFNLEIQKCMIKNYKEKIEFFEEIRALEEIELSQQKARNVIEELKLSELSLSNVCFWSKYLLPSGEELLNSIFEKVEALFQTPSALSGISPWLVSNLRNRVG